MKVRLTGIMEENIPRETHDSAPGAGVNIPVKTEKVILARFQSPELPEYYVLMCPAAVVAGAQVGDEFNILFEPAKN